MNKRRKENKYRPRKAAAPPADFMGNLEVGLKVIMIVTVVVLSTLFFIFVENATTQCGLFSLKQVSISGNPRLSRDEIIEQAGFQMEDNIIDINLDHIRQKLISHPWIADAAVKRVMPSKIEITIKEQKALAVVRIQNRADIVINLRGEPFYENDGIGNAVYGTPGGDPAIQLNDDHAPDGKMGTKKRAATVAVPLLPGADDTSTQAGKNNPVFKERGHHPLPVITGLKLTMGPDNQYHFSGRLHEAVMTLLRMEKKEVIQQISADHETGIAINTIIHQNPHSLQADEESVKIMLGFGNFKEKFKKIRHIIKYMQKNNFDKQICSIDLINPENIVIQIKDGDALAESQQGGV